MIFDAKVLITDLSGMLGVIATKPPTQASVEPTEKFKTWLTTWKDLLTSTLQNWEPGTRGLMPAQPYTLGDDDLEPFIGRIKRYGCTGLLRFHALCDHPFRMMVDGQAALVGFTIKVRAEETDMMILDASYTIHELEKADASIVDAQTLEPWVSSGFGTFAEIKRFDRMTIHRLAHSGARIHVVKDKAVSGSLVREVVKVIGDLKPSDHALIFTYLKTPSGKDLAAHLKRELQAKRIATNRTADDGTGKLKPCLNWLTWGQETSVNDFSFCNVLILVGILHLPMIEVAVRHMGQKQSLEYTSTKDELEALGLSDRTVKAHQGVSRGVNRQTFVDAAGHTQAKECTVWMIERDPRIENGLPYGNVSRSTDRQLDTD
jgi:hypothetical protein